LSEWVKDNSNGKKRKSKGRFQQSRFDMTSINRSSTGMPYSRVSSIATTSSTPTSRDVHVLQSQLHNPTMLQQNAEIRRFADRPLGSVASDLPIRQDRWSRRLDLNRAPVAQLTLDPISVRVLAELAPVARCIPAHTYWSVRVALVAVEVDEG
jgi:hypothetical protein